VLKTYRAWPSDMVTIEVLSKLSRVAIMSNAYEKLLTFSRLSMMKYGALGVTLAVLSILPT
jgi:hypothetical protein